jgi:hypothetical protein
MIPILPFRFLVQWAKPSFRRIQITLMALLLVGTLAHAQSDSADAAATDSRVEHLPPVEVTGREPMGLRAGIAAKGMLLGRVARVTVAAVVKDGRAAKLGVLKGDELIAINGTQLVGMKKSEVYALMEMVSQG